MDLFANHLNIFETKHNKASNKSKIIWGILFGLGKHSCWVGNPRHQLEHRFKHYHCPSLLVWFAGGSRTLGAAIHPHGGHTNDRGVPQSCE
jgi:hypothetical protein